MLVSYNIEYDGKHDGLLQLHSKDSLRYTLHMKRTNLVLDEQLLEEATRLSGERTFSAAVMRALTDYVRRARAGKLLELKGSGLWEGDLSAMRGDAPLRRAPRTSRASR
jgi:Arc/MetJ family transcription regulator